MGVISIDKKRTDWHRIKGEYVAGGISQRDLAKKYGLSWSTLQKRAAREHWAKARSAACAKVVEKVVQKAAEKNADNATLAADIKRKGLLILDGLFDDFATVMATERRESKNGVTDIKRLRDLTAAYKDLTEDITNPEAEDSPLLRSLYKLIQEGQNAD